LEQLEARLAEWPDVSAWLSCDRLGLGVNLDVEQDDRSL